MLHISTLPRSDVLRRRLSITSVLAAMGAAVLDASSMNLALPSISKALGVEPSDAAWLVIAYQAAIVASLLPMAALGDRWGSHRVFIGGVSLFGASALVCMVTPSFTLMIMLRMLQGIGAAAVMSLGVALLRHAVAPDQLGKAIGWNAMTVALMSAAGPTIGAALLSAGSWRFVFLGGIALTVISLGVAYALPSTTRSRRSIDGQGMVSYVAIVFALVIAVGLVRLWPGFSIMLFMCAVFGLWIFVRRDLRLTSPFIPLDLLRIPTFKDSVIASVTCFTGLSIALLMLPFALHMRLDANPMQIAMLMTPWPLAVLLTTPVASGLLSRFGTAHLCAAGSFCTSIGLAILAMASSTSGPGIHVFAIILCGTGFGLFQTPNNRSMFLAAPVERAASAGGLQSTARLTGQVIGALFAAVLLSAFTVLTANRLGFVLAGATSFVAGLVGVRRMRN